MELQNITLVSNVSKGIFPKNTVARFSCQLPKTMEFDEGKYQVAMTGFQCTKSWYNVSASEDFSIALYEKTEPPFTNLDYTTWNYKGKNRNKRQFRIVGEHTKF